MVQRSWLPIARQALVAVLSLRGRSHHQPQLNRWCVYQRQVDSPHSQQPPASTPQPRSCSVPPGIASHTESPSGDRDVPRAPCAGASQPVLRVQGLPLTQGVFRPHSPSSHREKRHSTQDIARRTIRCAAGRLCDRHVGSAAAWPVTELRRFIHAPRPTCLARLLV